MALVLTPIFLAFILLPFYMTYRNIKGFTQSHLSNRDKIWDLIGVCLGFILTVLFLSLIDVTSSDWQEQLSNSQVHSPLFSEALLTIFTLGLISLSSYLLLNFGSLEKIPPLLLSISIGGLYLGIGLAGLWIIQMSSLLESKDWEGFIFSTLYAINLLLLFLKTLYFSTKDWANLHDKTKTYKFRLLGKLHAFLLTSKGLPLLGLLTLLPLMSLTIIVLSLLGQEPDSLIKTWTETSDWQLSQQISPQNVYYDQHYLCTVGASGHRKLVKPLRMGLRHGRPVVVNRQLCIANAFEQILEEKIPRIHRIIRKNYDRYGYPIARHIKRAWQADMIYLVMKPLEWFFLAVIYLCDPDPETRIARQYLPNPPQTKPWSS